VTAGAAPAGPTAAERVLPLLNQVRPGGQDRWRALCPAHDDHSPSLSIRCTDDRLLLHCWAGAALRPSRVHSGSPWPTSSTVHTQNRM